MTREREYAEGDLQLLLSDRVLYPLEVRVLHANLRRRLPMLLELWDAAQQVAGTVSMSAEDSCHHTFGIVDKEPIWRLLNALEALRVGARKTDCKSDQSHEVGEMLEDAMSLMFGALPKPDRQLREDSLRRRWRDFNIKKEAKP